VINTAATAAVALLCSCTITAINTVINTAAALLLLCCCCFRCCFPAAFLLLLLCYYCCFAAAALLLRPTTTYYYSPGYEITTFHRSEALLNTTRIVIQVILNAEQKELE